jgi:hypothetical protein
MLMSRTYPSVVFAARALATSQLEQAELADLTPELRAQLQATAVNGNSITEVLQVMLLNNIKIKHQASQIVAMDWAKGVVVQLPNGNLEVVDLSRGRCRSKVSRVGTSTPAGGGTIM